MLQAHNFVFDPPLQVCFEHTAVHDVHALFAAAQQPFRVVPANVSDGPVIPRPLHGFQRVMNLLPMVTAT